MCKVDKKCPTYIKWTKSLNVCLCATFVKTGYINTLEFKFARIADFLALIFFLHSKMCVSRKRDCIANNFNQLVVINDFRNIDMPYLYSKCNQ